MSNYNDLFVAIVALVCSTGAFLAAVSSWQQPYQLRTIAGVVDRYGMPAARVVWISIAIIFMMSAAAIVSGVRPGYAKPQGTIEGGFAK